MKCMINEREQIIPEEEIKVRPKIKWTGEGVEGKVSRREMREFLSREIGEK